MRLEDENMIRNWMSDYIERWNNHDAKAISLLFEEDADFIGGSGGLIKGRSEIEKLMEVEHSSVLKEWKLSASINDIRFLKPDVAIANGAYEATGIASNAQAAPLKGLHTSIMCKRGETWICVGARSIVR
jgi:uncharacterized protein (TIGR02246 family)